MTGLVPIDPLPNKKTGTSDENSSKFRLVPMEGRFSNRLLGDLEKLSQVLTI